MSESKTHTQIELEESDFNAKNLKRFGRWAEFGLLASFTYGVVALFELGPDWLHLFIIAAAFLAYIMCADSSLDKLSKADEDEGDEWQRSMVQRSRSMAFSIGNFMILFTVIVLIAFDIFRVNMDLNVNLDNLKQIFLAVLGIMIFLPRAILSVIIKPMDEVSES